jgi:hypothetical protein
MITRNWKVEDPGLQACYTMSLGQCFLVFQRNVAPSFSRVEGSLFLHPSALAKEGNLFLQNVGKHKTQQHAPEDMNPQ